MPEEKRIRVEGNLVIEGYSDLEIDLMQEKWRFHSVFIKGDVIVKRKDDEE